MLVVKSRKIRENFIKQRLQTCILRTKHIFSLILLLKLYVLLYLNVIIGFGVSYNVDNSFTQ